MKIQTRNLGQRPLCRLAHLKALVRSQETANKAVAGQPGRSAQVVPPSSAAAAAGHDLLTLRKADKWRL
jgi:hypothetical protein